MRSKHYGYLVILSVLISMIAVVIWVFLSSRTRTSISVPASRFVVAAEAVLSLRPEATIQVNSPLASPANVQTMSPLPAPTRADLVGVRSSGILVTPLPDEKVKLGQVVEIAAKPTPTLEPPSFLIQNEFQGDDISRLLTLYVSDESTGTKQRLGDDSGSAVFGAMDNSRVIWTFFCDPCTTMQQGMYVYSPETGSRFLNSNRASKPKLSGEWVVYLYVESMNSDYADLYAHNLTSGEDLLITADFARTQSGIEALFALGENKVVWVTTGQPPSMYVHDLALNSTHQLNVPEITIPLYLSVQGNMVTWLDNFWQGYDLTLDAYFTIPVIPAQWQDAMIQQISPVTVVGDQLYWNVTIDNQTHYLTAPVISNTQ